MVAFLTQLTHLVFCVCHGRGGGIVIDYRMSELQMRIDTFRKEFMSDLTEDQSTFQAQVEGLVAEAANIKQLADGNEAEEVRASDMCQLPR